MTSIRPARKPAAPKTPVHAQNCGNCFFSRPVGPTGNYGIECRYDAPLWHRVDPRAGWCRRWKQQEPAPQPVAKSEPHDTEAKGS